MDVTLEWGSEFSLLVLLVFFVCTAWMDLGTPPTWVKFLRGVACIVTALLLLTALL